MNHSLKIGLVIGTLIGVFGYIADATVDAGFAIIGGIVWGLGVAAVDAAVGKWWKDPQPATPEKPKEAQT